MDYNLEAERVNNGHGKQRVTLVFPNHFSPFALLTTKAN